MRPCFLLSALLMLCSLSCYRMERVPDREQKATRVTSIPKGSVISVIADRYGMIAMLGGGWYEASGLIKDTSIEEKVVREGENGAFATLLFRRTDLVNSVVHDLDAKAQRILVDGLRASDSVFASYTTTKDGVEKFWIESAPRSASQPSRALTMYMIHTGRLYQLSAVVSGDGQWMHDRMRELRKTYAESRFRERQQRSD